MGMIAAGRDIDHYCTRCKMDLAHTIIAVVGDVPARVKCNTCHTERNFRRGRAAAADKKAGVVRRGKTAQASKRTTSNARSTAKARNASTTYEKSEKWTTLMGKARKAGTDAKAYSMRDTYPKGAVVDHSKFGEGYVEEIVPPNKVLVCFEEGDRLLIHGRK